MPSNLSDFGLPERLRCSNGIRRAADGTRSVEEAARKLCDFFFDELVDSSGDRACALVRCYITQPFAQLPSSLQEFATAAAGGSRVPVGTRCLTLLATRGIERAWNARTQSNGHRAIPLLSTEMIEKAPMISQLIRAFGLKAQDVIADSGSIVQDLEGRTYGVFFVPDAAGSPYIPAQSEFVEPHGIKSVIGCGGALASGELFAIVLFARIGVAESSAERFRALALDAKAAFLRFSPDEIFDAGTD